MTPKQSEASAGERSTKRCRITQPAEAAGRIYWISRLERANPSCSHLSGFAWFGSSSGGSSSHQVSCRVSTARPGPRLDHRQSS